jgi:hypothetical protein
MQLINPFVAGPMLDGFENARLYGVTLVNLFGQRAANMKPRFWVLWAQINDEDKVVRVCAPGGKKSAEVPLEQWQAAEPVEVTLPWLKPATQTIHPKDINQHRSLELVK